MIRFLFLIPLGFLATQVLADDAAERYEFGSDTFLAGRSVTHAADNTDDLFMAGDTVVVGESISGSAHLAGRAVTIDANVAGDAYVFGEEVLLSRDVGGDVTVAGRTVELSTVGGDLRAAGAEVRLTGDVGGYAIVAGDEVEIDGTVSGDMSLSARDVSWGDGASVSGRLILYEDEPGALAVPSEIVPSERLERREIEEWEGPEPPSFRRAVANFFTGVIVVAALAALVATLVPERLAEMRRQVLSRPFYCLWLGFLVQSAVIGAGILFAMTLVGLVLTPAMVLLALAGGFAGYVVAAYSFGVGLMMAFNQAEPDSIGQRALAAGVGALAAGIIGLIPILGWIFVLVLVLTGIGAITLRVIRPAFFADATI